MRRLRVAVAVAAVVLAAAATACQPGPATCDGRTATIVGTSAGESLTGTPGPDVIVAHGGDDTVYGGGGDDVVCGGSGTDRLDGGNDADVIDGGPDKDTIHGGSGVDEVTYRREPQGVVVDLFGRTGPGGEPLTEIENVVGSPYDDRIFGDNGDNRLTTLDGSDTVFGYPGHDWIIDAGTSAAARNTFSGGAGNDTVIGGPGRDFVSLGYYQAPFSVYVDLATGVAIGDGEDRLSNVEDVAGTDNVDMMFGDDRGNELIGFGGNDLLDGRGGDDTLNGGLGTDWGSWRSAAAPIDASLVTDRAVGQGTDSLLSLENLAGGSAGDVLTGDAGANAIDGRGGVDACTGGGGADTFNACP